MTGELFLVCGFAGYWFLKIWNFTRLATIRAAGYHVLFRSVFVGGLLLIAAKGISSFLDGTDFQFLRLLHEGLFFIGEVLFPVSPTEDRYTDVAVLTIALGFVLPLLANAVASLDRIAERLPWFLCTRLAGALRDAKKRGQVTDVILMESCHQAKTVEVLLKNQVA